MQEFLDESAEAVLLTGGDGADGGGSAALAAVGRHDRVAVTVRDRGALRALRLPAGIRTAAIAVWLDSGVSAPTLVSRPEWAPLQVLRSRPVDGGWLVVLRFAAPVPVHAVVAELGRQSVWPDRFGLRGLVVDDEGTTKMPSDVVTRPARGDAGQDSGAERVTGRASYVLEDPDGPLALGPLDERVLNPIGYDATADGPVRDLVDLDLRDGATEALVRSLRDAAAVHVSWPGDPGLALQRAVAGLAMAGVPLVSSGPVPAHLGPRTVTALQEAFDPTDALAREEHSVLLRRAALTEHSSFAWRRRLGERSGVRVQHQPSVSVVMATRRPDLLQHAVAQVARQRGVDAIELVLAPHGFRVLAEQVEDLAPGLAVQVVPAAPDTLFGDVLEAARIAADGDVVLKMDDDDWYGPDFVADLLLARSYSGAELVGVPDDWHYLEPRDLTVRLGTPVEVYRQFVAGGSTLVDAVLLGQVGGFRSVRRAVDAQLIGAVRSAGGTVFRTHGLGYLMRKCAGGHTWVEDLDELVARPGATTYPGFRPSRLLT